MGIGVTSSTNEYLRAQAAGVYAGTNGIARAGVNPFRGTKVTEPAGTTIDKTAVNTVVSKYATGVETSNAVTAPRKIETGAKVNGNFFMSNLSAMQANYQNASAFRGVAAVDGYASQATQASDDLAQYDALKNFKSGNLLFVK